MTSPLRDASAAGGASLPPLDPPVARPRQPDDALVLLSFAGSVGGRKVDILSGLVSRRSWSSGSAPQHRTLFFSAACECFAEMYQVHSAAYPRWVRQQVNGSTLDNPPREGETTSEKLRIVYLDGRHHFYYAVLPRNEE